MSESLGFGIWVGWGVWFYCVVLLIRWEGCVGVFGMEGLEGVVGFWVMMLFFGFFLVFFFF